MHVVLYVIRLLNSRLRVLDSILYSMNFVSFRFSFGCVWPMATDTDAERHIRLDFLVVHDMLYYTLGARSLLHLQDPLDSCFLSKAVSKRHPHLKSKASILKACIHIELIQRNYDPLTTNSPKLRGSRSLRCCYTV
jgi:hypothetical protein